MPNSADHGSCDFLPEDHVGALLALYPAAADHLADLGIDTTDPTATLVDRCPGERCEAVLLDLARTVEGSAWEGDADQLCSNLAIDELIDHICTVHHRFTRAELGRLARIADHIRAILGLGTDTPGWFCDFDRLRRHLLAHLAEEESLLFPRARKLEGQALERPISSRACDHSLHVMEHGHREVEDTFTDLVNDLAAESWPQEVAADVRRFVDGIDTLRRDTAIHSYKEDEYLLPAIAYADELFDSRQRARRRHETE